MSTGVGRLASGQRSDQVAQSVRCARRLMVFMPTVVVALATRPGQLRDLVAQQRVERTDAGDQHVQVVRLAGGGEALDHGR